VAETRTVHDPFLNKDVQVSARLTDRLRGKYAVGPIVPDGEPEFGWRLFPVPPIQPEAAAEIDRLSAKLVEATEERDDLQRTFDLQWEADQRAIKRWQEAHPGNDLVWPDRADMVVWLMEQLASARKAAIFHPDQNMPGCMMPDGGECCAGHAALAEDWHKQRREIEGMRAFIKQLSDTLLTLRPLGGSECFVQRFGAYYADPEYFKAQIEHDTRKRREGVMEIVRLKRELGK
jgi:hypothetical protein